MNFRRLACVLSAVPLAFYAYACSSDDGGAAPNADAGGSSGSSGTSGTSGSSGTSGGLDAGDAGDGGDGAVPITCVGNPLLALSDAGTPDGGATTDAAATQQIVSPLGGGFFLDGPQWVTGAGGAESFLVFSEYQPTERLRRVAADGGALSNFRTAVFSATVGPIGNGFRNGFLLTTATGKGGGTPPASLIFQTAPDGGAGPTLPVGAAGSPNDLVVGAGGRIYFTDPGYQSGSAPGIYATAADGGAAIAIGVVAGADQPNGIALSPDGTKLYVSFTNAAGKRVDSFVVATDGSVGATATTVILKASLTDSPDGLAVDVGGNIYVAEANATLATNSGRVQVFTSAGVKLGEIPFPGERPTGVTFGGLAGTQLFITGENGVYVYNGRCAGIP